MMQDIQIPVPGGGTRPGVIARPKGEGPFPGVVVIHDVTGFKPDTRRHCQRFAEAGYVAIAPDLYDGGRIRCVVRTLIDSLDRRGGETLPVLAATKDLLASLPEVDAERIGVTGFCMGGGFALVAAADHHYAVAAPFYGFTPESKERIEGICPTLAQYGERDKPFLKHAKRLSRHLDELGVEHEVIVHPGVGHSFMNDHDDASFRLGKYLPIRAAYDAETEAVAWEKLLAFFDAHMPG